MSFYIAILAATFGKGSQRPVLAACIRLGILFATAIGLGGLISHSLGNGQPHLNQLAFWQMAPYATFTIEIVVVFGLLGTVGIWQAKNSLRTLMQCWPITNRQRIIADILPYGVVIGITLALSLPILSTIFAAIGFHLTGLLLSTVLGIGAASGVFAVAAVRPLFGALLTPIVLWTQYQTLTYVQNTASALSTHKWHSLLFWATVSLLILLVPLLFKRRAVTGSVGTIRTLKLPLPYFFKKVLRAKQTRISGLATLLLSIGIGYAVYKQAAASWQLPFSIGAILLATLVADLRSLSVRHNPVEITNLRGTMHFTQWQIMTALGATLCVSPLLVLAVTYSSASQILLLCGETLFVLSIGLLAGTLIVPEPGDISGQCLTALLCVGVFCLPLLTPLGTWGVNSQVTTYLVAAIIITSVACLTEYRRNPYTWRRIYETKQ